MHVNDLLKLAVDASASDLHLKVGSFPLMRVRGALMPIVEDKRLEHDDVVAMGASIMSASRSRSADTVCERESNVWFGKPLSDLPMLVTENCFVWLS